MKRVLALFTVFTALAVAAPAAPSNSKSYSKTKTSNQSRSAAESRTAVVAYTLAGCSDCAAFKRYLRQSGVRYSTTYTRESPVSLYPTVVYSDGGSDNGERVYARQVKLPKSLKLIETN